MKSNKKSILKLSKTTIDTRTRIINTKRWCFNTETLVFQLNVGVSPTKPCWHQLGVNIINGYKSKDTTFCSKFKLINIDTEI